MRYYYDIDLAISNHIEARENYLEHLTKKYREQLQYCEMLGKRLVQFVPDIDKYEEAFCDTINEAYEISHGKLRIGGVYITPSTALRKCDRRAYDEALCSYTSTEFESYPERDSDYMELSNEYEAAELELEEQRKHFIEMEYTIPDITTD